MFLSKQQHRQTQIGELNRNNHSTIIQQSGAHFSKQFSLQQLWKEYQAHILNGKQKKHGNNLELLFKYLRSDKILKRKHVLRNNNSISNMYYLQSNNRSNIPSQQYNRTVGKPGSKLQRNANMKRKFQNGRGFLPFNQAKIQLLANGTRTFVDAHSTLIARVADTEPELKITKTIKMNIVSKRLLTSFVLLRTELIQCSR